ncbi:MAG: CHAT domain-containing protein [Bacteroidetes bacterium]|nr:CHAT domain-containing protein [Bacteroidota bacterium]
MNQSMFRISLFISGIMISIFPGGAKAQEYCGGEIDESIRAYLSQEEVILLYVLTDSVLSLTAVDCHSAVKTTVTLNNLFWECLNVYRKKIKSADFENFYAYSELLYLYLVEPVQDILINKNRLIIVPDKVLEEIPFEALTTDKLPVSDAKSDAPNFLINNFEVVYRRAEFLDCCNHTNGLDDCQDNQDEFRYAFIGFSPEFATNGNFCALPGTKAELLAIGSLFRKNGLSSRLVEGSSAKKDYFTKMVSRGKIIHLATHYYNGSDCPYNNGFLFCCNEKNDSHKSAKEDVLTIGEICNLHCNADLVVLNACSSGIERLQSGKYRNVIPEVFLTAGARNILTTLWNVTDKLTSPFMALFYRLLLEGKSYSGALREAKLQMIKHRETSLPTVWAPYILTSR